MIAKLTSSIKKHVTFADSSVLALVQRFDSVNEELSRQLFYQPEDYARFRESYSHVRMRQKLDRKAILTKHQAKRIYRFQANKQLAKISTPAMPAIAALFRQASNKGGWAPIAWASPLLLQNFMHIRAMDYTIWLEFSFCLEIIHINGQRVFAKWWSFWGVTVHCFRTERRQVCFLKLIWSLLLDYFIPRKYKGWIIF